MANNPTQRPYRTNNIPAQNAASVSGNDPLAELARLIGQTDPFGEFGRQNARRAPAASAAPATAPSFGPADYFDAPSAPPPHPAPLQPPPNFPPPPRMRQPYAAHPEPTHGDDGAHAQGYADHGVEHAYEDEAPPRRRIGIIAIAALFVIAVIGTAGAFGYRAMFGSRSSGPPPVIKADTSQIKVVPAAGDKAPNKLIYDRVVDQGQGEKVVSREEKPVEVKSAEIKTVPPLAAAPQQADAIPPGPGGSVIATEPKKVHTIAIRPEQMGDNPQAPVAAAPPPPAPVAPRAVPQVAAPLQAANPPPAANPAPPPMPEREARAVAPARPAPPPPNAPLSLNPDAQQRTMRTAAVAPVAAPAAPAAATHTGGYAVQVSSQRSEAEAQAAFHSLQTKFPNLLGTRQAMIHKVDLGSKGTYYRALVGPFADASEATQLCSGLKAAGAACLIQRN